MSKKWNELKDEYFYPSYPMCWACERRTAVDGGHGVINKGQLNNAKRHKDLDVKENFVPQCAECNRHGAVDSFEVRRRMYYKKCDELGKERVDRWLDSLDLKVKPRF